MLENFFITYANNIFYKKENNIFKIFESIKSNLKNEFQADQLKKEFELIFEYSANTENALKVYKSKYRYQLAYGAVFSFKHGFCEDVDAGKDYPGDKGNSCKEIFGTDYKNVLTANNLKKDVRLNCHECRQFQFINTLDQIIAGEKYSEILFGNIRVKNETYQQRVFNSIFNSCYNFIIKNNSLTKDDKIISIDDNICLPLLWAERSDFDFSENSYRHRFNRFIESIVGYSLIEFLKNHDRRRLIKCDWCGKYQIKQRVAQKNKINKNTFCSIECGKALHDKQKKETKYMTEYMKEYRNL
jgi:hypothetical protein